MSTDHSEPREWLTVPEIARDMRLSRAKILHWISTGQLRAHNMATDADSKRPRWLVRREDYERFLASRAAIAPAPTPQRRRKADVPQYV